MLFAREVIQGTFHERRLLAVSTETLLGQAQPGLRGLLQLVAGLPAYEEWDLSPTGGMTEGVNRLEFTRHRRGRLRIIFLCNMSL